MHFFAGPGLRVISFDRSVIDRATEIRALQGLRTPGAIHTATAIVARADVFVTGDRALARVTDPRVVIL
jgi:predicted nucleic acid-binding protein